MNRVRSSVGRLEGLWGEVVGYRRRLGLAEARAYVEGKGEGEKGEVGGLVVIAVRGRDYWVVD